MTTTSEATPAGVNPTTWGAETRFRTIFEQSPVSTQVFLPDGLSIAVNAAWERLWGVTLAQISPYNILEDQQLVDKGSTFTVRLPL